MRYPLTWLMGIAWLIIDLVYGTRAFMGWGIVTLVFWRWLTEND